VQSPDSTTNMNDKSIAITIEQEKNNTMNIIETVKELEETESICDMLLCNNMNVLYACNVV